MSGLLQCLSHSPLMGQVDPDDDILSQVNTALNQAKDAIFAFNPELILLFAPDHYNGFFYDVMPSFCIGTHAYAIGDYGTAKGTLTVPEELAEAAAQYALNAGVDVALSRKMQVDHGFAQPLDLLLGGVDIKPVIPVFINSVAVPLPSFQRARLLGQTLGQWAAGLKQRVLIIGSGGLSHQPPVPEIKGADAHTTELLLGRGKNLSAEERTLKNTRILDVARRFAQDQTTLLPLNETWDQWFLDGISKGELTQFDHIGNAELSRQAGKSAHEVKTWVAAASAMQAFGPYQQKSRFYQAIPEWIAGFGAFTATST